MTQNISLYVPCGASIVPTIGEAIGLARNAGTLAEFDFNGVLVMVAGDSDEELIYRDWDRASSGYIDASVGPYPKVRLSKADLLNDKRAKDSKERKYRKQVARWEREAQEHRERTEAKLATAPAMEYTDEDAWQQALSVNTDSYSRAVMTFAERWARLMQAELANGEELENIASATSEEADIEGITGFMYGFAVHILSGCWKHGDQLRNWHNRKYGASDDVEGTVNPAILTISPA